MNLGETILSRRKALALTQEQVAERLGVTPQAVYKWEKDIACPDVQLLSPLARLLETDLNTLFAYDTEPDKVELSAIIERVSRLALQKGGQEAAFAEARAALRKYSASAQLRLSLAIVLEGALVAQGGGDAEAQREVEEMYRFAAKSEDARVRDAARGIRVRRLIHKGQLDEAEALLDALPDPPAQKWHYRAQLLKARGEVDAAAALVEERIFGEASGLCTALAMLLDMAMEEEDFAWADALAQVLEQTAQTFGLWQGSAASAQLEIAVKRRDADEAMAALEIIAEAVKGPWTPDKHPLYRHVHFKENGSEWLKKMPEALRTSVWSDEHYAFLHENPRRAQRLRELFGAPDGQA